LDNKKLHIEPISPIYSETQHFRQLWLWAIFTVPTVVTILSLTLSIINTPSNKGIMISITLICSIFLSLLAYLIFIASLDTKITANGVFIKFRPFHRKWILFPFENIKEAKSHKYNPIRDYGGWGIRYSTKGKAYNVSGDMGVLIKFSDDTNLLIGSQKHLDLASVISNHLR